MSAICLRAISCICLLCVCLTGCSGVEANRDEENYHTPVENVRSEIAQNIEAPFFVTHDPFADYATVESAEAVDMLKKVLRSEAGFLNPYSDNADAEYLSGIYMDKDTTIMDFKLEHAVVDMDGDGIPEVVLNLMGPDIRILFHYTDDGVVGHFLGIKEMNGIFYDGTFSWGSATRNGYSRITFFGKAYKHIDLAYYDGTHPNLESHRFVIDSVEVTAEEYSIFVDSQNRKEEVKWHHFTTYNLE